MFVEIRFLSRLSIINSISDCPQLFKLSHTPYGKGNLKKNINRINNLDISESEKRLILGDNMKRLLKL